MYKFVDNQISFEDFEQPMGMNIRRDNRWVVLAESILRQKLKRSMPIYFKASAEMLQSHYALH